jgi:uncharacterized protein (DUF2062 family)
MTPPCSAKLGSWLLQKSTSQSLLVYLLSWMTGFKLGSWLLQKSTSQSLLVYPLSWMTGFK